MTPENKLNYLIQLYSRINTFPKLYKGIITIDKPMRWLLADKNEQFVSVFKKTNSDKILNIDIASCFPTICKYLFSDTNMKFVEEIYSLDDKLERNILISNTLKHTGYIKYLNIISKMIILGYTFERRNSSSINLLEFEKDGILIFSNDDDYNYSIKSNEFNTDFLKFIEDNDFKFHFEEYDYYLRYNRTSIFWKDKDKYFRIKGMYKNLPSKIKEFMIKMFSGEKLNLAALKEIYTHRFFKIITHNNLDEFLKDYYFFSDNSILSTDGKLMKFNYKTEVNPHLYLQYFVHPVVLFQKQISKAI